MNLRDIPENTEILEQLAEQISDVFFIFDTANQQFRYLSPSFDEVWNTSRYAVLETPASLVNYLPDEDREYLLNLWQKGTWKNETLIEFRITTTAGVIKWISLKVFPLQNKENESIMGFAEDITSKKEHQFVLLKFAERKNAILHSISHDLAGPIHIINNLAAIISEEAKSYENSRINETIEYVQRTCKKSISLIKELLNNEFLESSQVELNKWRFDVAYKVNDVLNVYRQADLANPKQISYSSSQPKIYITADEAKFMQVINNLISNAIKFTPEGGNIDLTLTDQGTTILLTIADTGIGIPEDLHPFLFDKFTKARRPGLLGEEPVGLGMSIIKNIVELHRGKIWFTSQENAGSTFFIEIPKE